MTIELIIDDRNNPLHVIRTRGGRRFNETFFRSHTSPFKDSNDKYDNHVTHYGYQA